MTKTTRVAVLGGGSWGTALVKLLLVNTSQVGWYLRDPGQAEFIRNYGHNPRYLDSLQLDAGRIRFFTDPSEAIGSHDILIMAIPSSFVCKTLEGISESLAGKTVVSAIKGIIPDCNRLLSDYFREQHQVRPDDYVMIAGPCHAEEVAMEKLSYLTLASGRVGTGRAVASLLGNPYIKTTVIQDVVGTEYATALKNIMAIAAGITHGLNYGDNFQAVLISNALQEMKRFLRTVHPQTRDIKGSSYLGDLLVTAYSRFSRNRTFGTMIGKGYSVRSALLEMRMTVEGYHSAACIHRMNEKWLINMPITDAVYNILYGNISPALEIRILAEQLR